jgi:hypothetical protein
MFLRVHPAPPMSVYISQPAPVPASEKFSLSQSPMFPYYVPSLEDVKGDLEGLVAEIDILEDRVERTHALYVSYYDTEEQLLSKEIFYDHVRHFQKAFMSLLGYLETGHKVKYTEDERLNGNTIFCLVGLLDVGDNSMETRIENDSTICHHFLEFTPPKHTYAPPAATDRLQPTIYEVLLMVRRIHDISRGMVRSHWEKQLNNLLDHEDNDSSVWNPMMTASEFESIMLNMP